MTKKNDKVFIGIDDQIKELTGIELEEFEQDRKEIFDTFRLVEQNLQAHKELKISAYKKLGLTDEEINAII